MGRDIDTGFTVFADTKPAVRPMRGLIKVTKQADKEMDRFGKNLKQRAVVQQRSFATAIRASTVALTGLGVALLKTATIAGDYDRQIRLAAFLTKNTEEKFAEFDAGVKQISSDLAILPSQVAKAAQAVGKLGFEGAGAMEVLRQGVTLARASLGELTSAQAVGAASTILKAFGQDASQARRAVDVLTTGVTSTALSFEKLPTALSTASGFAAAFGATMEETIAILGATNDIITKTERAATGVRNIFRDLSQVVTKQKLASAGLNIEILTQAGNFRGILPILSDLFEQTSQMTEAERLQTIQRGFTVESAGALFAITQRLKIGFRDQNGQMVKGIGGLKALVKRMEQTGVASALADTQLEGFAGAMESFKVEGALLAESIGKALNTVLVPALKFVTGLITDMKDAFENASPVTKTMIGIFGTAAIVLGAVGVIVIGATVAMGGWAFVTGIATGANLAFLTSLGPIAIVLTAVIALIFIFQKQINKARAAFIKFTAFVNLREVTEGEQAEIDELEGKVTDPSGGRVDQPAAPTSAEAITASIASAIAAASAPARTWSLLS